MSIHFFVHLFSLIQRIFKVTPFDPQHWLLALGIGRLPLIAMELWKTAQGRLITHTEENTAREPVTIAIGKTIGTCDTTDSVFVAYPSLFHSVGRLGFHRKHVRTMRSFALTRRGLEDWNYL